MDIGTIASIGYVIVLVVYTIIMTVKDVNAFSVIYWGPLVCIVTAYICGCAKGGAGG